MMSSSSPPERMVSLLYHLLLMAYPHHFRQKFGSDMQQVFLDCWRTASEQGKGALLMLGWRIFVDLILTAPRECLAEWQQAFSAFYGRVTMNSGGAFWRVRQPGSWLESVWAVFPYALLVLLVFLPPFLVAIQWLPKNWVDNGGVIVGGVAILLVSCLASFIIAWRKRWPRWAGSWLVFWSVCVVGLISTIQQHFYQQAEAIVSVLTVMILPFLIAWLVYRMAYRNPMAGLLGVLPLVASLQIIVQEFLPAATDALLNMAVFLMICIVVIAIIRTGSWRLGFWLIAGLILVVNALGVYAAQYLVVLPPEAGLHTPDPMDKVAVDTLITTVGVLTILIGPFLARRVREIGIHAGMWGGIAYRLLLLGVIFLIFGLIIGPYAANTGNSVTAMFWESHQLGEIFNGIGVFIYVIGAGLLPISALAARQHLTWIKTILVMILPGTMPLFFWLNLGLIGLYPSILPQGISHLIAVGLGGAWCGLSYWLVTHYDSQPSPTYIATQVG